MVWNKLESMNHSYRVATDLITNSDKLIVDNLQPTLIPSNELEMTSNS